MDNLALLILLAGMIALLVGALLISLTIDHPAGE